MAEPFTKPKANPAGLLAPELGAPFATRRPTMAIDGIGSGTPAYKPQVTDAKPAAKAAEPVKAEAASPSFSQKLGEGFDAVKKKLMSISGRFASPAAAAAPASSSLSQDVAFQRSAVNANYTLMPTLHAQAEREMPALDTKPININTPEGRKQLVSDTSQINEVSKKAGNSEDVCGGAAMANSLVLASKTPEQAKANSDALRAAAGKVTGLSSAEDTALKNMAKGQMSTTDMAHLQQLSFRLVKSQNPTEKQANPGEMAMAVTMLKANGGFPGPQPQTIEFHNTRLPPPGNANHWTVNVDDQYANSLNNNGYKGASVTNGVPADAKMNASNDKWRGGVTLQNYNNPPSIELDYRAKKADGSDDPSQMHSTTITNPEQYKMKSKTDFDPLDKLNAKVVSANDSKVRMGDSD